MLKRKIPIYFAVLLTFLGTACSYVVTTKLSKVEEKPVADNSIASCYNTRVRLSGYDYIRPLLYSDVTCQSQKLLSVKNEVNSLIDSYKQSGSINTASVYLRQLNQGDWISIDENEKYFPGSLMKVPELITFLKMNEKHPGLLDKKISYNQPLVSDKQAHYLSKTIEPGKTYTVRELLNYMISYSDNNATILLNQMMDAATFKKVFTDLGLAEPDLNAKNIPVTAKEYSVFMRVLYNSTYLPNEESEYCTELLTHSDFAGGLLSGLPKDIKVAHKFGEAGDAGMAHFSESGIVYIKNAPYLLTIMTKGKDLRTLPSVVASISRKVYEQINLKSS